jgi:hypothetical protein
MLVDFLNSWDKSKSIDESQAELINWYLVPQARGKFPLIACPTPGMTLFSSISGSVNRGGYFWQGSLYTVVDDKLYSIHGVTGAASLVYTGIDGTGLVRFKSNDESLLIVGDSAYSYVKTSPPVIKIADLFPGVVTTKSSVGFLDDYFLLSQNVGIVLGILSSGIIIRYSDVGDVNSWPALNFFSKTDTGEGVVSMIVFRSEIWVLGQRSGGVFFNSGAPFERSPGTSFEMGTPSPFSPVIANNNLHFLGQTRSGGPQFVRMNGYIPEKISNTSIDELLGTYSATDLLETFGYSYLQEGQEFIVWTIPNQNITLVYNTTTKSWHQWQSNINGTYGRHRSNWAVNAYGKVLMGDSQSGNIYVLDSSAYTEAGTAIRRKLTTYPFYKQGNMIFGDRLILELETGVGTSPQIDLAISKDGNHTFTTKSPTRNLGSSTNYGARLVYNRLGSSRQFAFQVTTTMTDRCVLLGATGEFRVGEF